jgi:hypothetical protein
MHAIRSDSSSSRSIAPRCVRSAVRTSALLAIALVTGCEQRQIRVEMAVTGDGTTRAFATNLLAKSDRERLESMYSAKAERDEATGGDRFAGTFAKELPSELGNRNGTSEVRTRLGTTRLYFESFAEPADEWSTMRARIDAGELWVRLFGRWAEKGIQDESKREEWRRYVARTLVPLSTELAVLWGSNATTAQALRVALRVRTTDDRSPLTVEERFLRQSSLPLLLTIARADMLTAEEAHRVLLIAADANATQAERDWVMRSVGRPALLRLVQRFRPETKDLEKVNWMPLALGFYLWAQTSSERNDVLLASPAISDADKEKLRKGETGITIPPPFGIELFAKPPKTETEVLLAMPERPFLTNGDWIEAEKRVRFKHDFLPAARRTSLMPPSFYAAWSEPDEAEQTRIFGAVILRGQDLADFAIWHESLSPEERNAWNLALDQLEQSGTRSLLEQFRDTSAKDRPLPEALQRWLREGGGAG